MKITSIILVCMGLMISNTVKAQKIILGDLATLELPTNAQKISSMDISAFAKSKKIDVQGSPETADKTIYVIQNVVFTFRIAKSKEKMDLAKLEKSLIALPEGPSEMKFRNYSYNGNSFLVAENAYAEKITVFGVNNKADIVIRIMIEFNKNDLSKANTVLEDVLKGIGFNQ